MKKIEKLIINDKYIYLKNKKYETKFICQGRIIDYNNAKNEIEKILKDNNLSKSIFKNSLIVVISNSLNSCEEFVIKSIFEELQINDIKILKINDCLFETFDSTNSVIIYYYEDYLELFVFNKCFIIYKDFINSIYNYLKKHNIKKIYIMSLKKDIKEFINNIKNNNIFEIYYNNNYIMQLFQ